MENRDFDKIFSQKINQLSEKSPSLGEWSAISARIDSTQKREKAWFYPFLLGLLALLVGSNLYWWKKNWDSTLALQPSGEKKTLVVFDTLIKKTVVIEYDTIYRGLRSSDSQESFARRSGSYHSFNNTSQNAPFMQSQFSNKDSRPQDSAKNTPNGQLNESTFQLEKEKLESAAPLELGNHSRKSDTIVHIYRENDSLFNLLLAIRSIEKPSKSPMIYFASPEVGLAGGVGYPQVPGKTTGFTGSMGIRGSVEIRPNLRWTASWTRSRTSIQSKDISLIPNQFVPVPGNDYYLDYWESYKMHSWELGTGLQYEWTNRLLFKPFIGLGFRFYQLRPFDIEFEFTNGQNSMEMFDQIELPEKDSGFGWKISAGGNVWLSPKWGFSTTFFYNTKGNPQVLPGFGFGAEAMMFYRLKSTHSNK